MNRSNLAEECAKAHAAHIYMGSDAASIIAPMAIAVVVVLVGGILLWSARPGLRDRLGLTLLILGIAILAVELGAVLPLR